MEGKPVMDGLPGPHQLILVNLELRSTASRSNCSLVVSICNEDLIECINKAMTFLSAVASRFPPSNNQLITSSNPRNHATIQDAGQPRVVKCYNCQGEGHMARQCTQSKRPRNAAWFKEKLMLAESQEAGLNENDQDSLNAAAGGNLLSKTTREALNIIENKSKVRYSRNKSNVSRMNTTSRESVSKTDERIDKLADQLSTLVEIVSKKVVTPAPVKAVEEICVTCSGPHAWYNCPNTDNNQSSVCAATGTYNQVNPPNRVSNQMAPPGFAPVQNNGQNSITTRSGVAYEGPSISTNPSPKKVVERETEETTDKEQSNFQGSTTHSPPPVNPIPKPDVPKTLPKPNISYPSRRNDQKSHEKASNLMEKIFQIFQDLRFDISFADALLLMPRFAPTIRNFLMNKEKLLELAKIPLNENCSMMLLKKLPEKLGDPGKFLIPCDFPRMNVCYALADLGASINLMPLSIWKKLFLPELTPTRMTLELADPSITHPKGLIEDVFVKVRKFHFPTDLVVVDFEPDPRVPLILGRSFLRTGRALIDVYKGELILRDRYERLIFHVNKHPQNHENESIKMIKFIDVSCEDSVGEVLRLKKSNHFLSGSTTPLSNSRLSLTSFETRDSLLEEFADELALLNPFPPGNEGVDFEAELIEIKLLLNRDSSTNFSPTFTIDTNPKKFTDEPAPACLSPPGDDESFLKEDVQEENFQDECFDPGGDNDEINAFLAIKISTYIEEGYYDSDGDVFYLERLLVNDTTHKLFPEVLFNYEPQCFKDESELDTLENMVKFFDPGIWEKTFSPSCVRLSSKDHLYLFFTIVVQILFTHHVNFLFSFRSEETIFDPRIFAFHFSSQEPVAVKCSMEFCFSTCFIPKDE
ncbi:reverse transcriptase domain-containing protein [Tanacetum coccineum]